MSLDKATVSHIAKLARIEVDDDHLGALAVELSNIMGWIEQLGEVDTSGVEPLRSVFPLPPAMRADEVTAGGDVEAVLGNAPERLDTFYVVPKVVE
ncbi:MAG: Asp-tRNA(Asn)/Glu-tRNA(Gln) amidotransferase subunit GatC [Geminicoccaceae bacterium]